MEFWVGGVPSVNPVKITELDYGLPYRSIVSCYERSHNFWLLSEENQAETEYTKLLGQKFIKGVSQPSITYDSPALPPENPKNLEDIFISSYSKTIPSSSDPITNQYIGVNHATINNGFVAEVDINQLINGVMLRNAIKTRNDIFDIDVMLKPVIVVNGIKQIDNANIKTIKVKVSGLGFAPEEAENIIIEDIAIGIF